MTICPHPDLTDNGGAPAAAPDPGDTGVQVEARVGCRQVPRPGRASSAHVRRRCRALLGGPGREPRCNTLRPPDRHHLDRPVTSWPDAGAGWAIAWLLSRHGPL